MKKLSLLLVFLLLFPVYSQAAQLFFGTDVKRLQVEDKITIGVFVASQSQDINAVEGTITFNSQFFSFSGIQDGGSVITLWIEQPASSGDGQIHFSGLMPGGFTGSQGYLFSVILQAQKTGKTTLASTDEKILLNDGTGLEVTVTKAPLQIEITEKTDAPSTFVPLYDADPPQAFELQISKDQHLFSGKWFLTFQAQDKGAGIDHYEILEKSQNYSLASLFNKNDAWIIGQSPYLLQDQKLESVILVKAIDRAGNSTVAALPAKNKISWYKNSWIFGIIIIIVLFEGFYFLIRKFYKKPTTL